ncbi:efflux RND transporter periplasmic adaptor subunit [Psychrobacter glaciei]|uniref:efflux RND transporter periplasmic adaptor subunit n=1 Tax=Psychrobacter glaciei TaxID=619771 RepID=UPI001F056655|nr:efflux RND transporter periplasmic adaptor subunit [Psychrobacter glaciei]MCH1783605.1 efflux RND transporter periplasmic adaptor subunit [Psychrobacter glaciei]
MNIKYWAFPLSVVLALTAACSKEPEVIDTKSEESSIRTVSVDTVILRPMTGSVTASGLLLPREEVAVGSEISGYRVAELLVDEGSTVKKNQVLARLDPSLLLAKIAQAEANLTQAKTLANQSSAEADRIKGYEDIGAFSEEEIATRVAKAKNSNAGVEVAQAQLNELQTQRNLMEVRSPVNGFVLERIVRLGDVSGQSQPMFRLASNSLIEMDAEVPEDDLATITVGQAATVILPSGAELQGKVRLLSPRIDPETKLGHVRVQLPTHPELRAGGYAKVVFQQVSTPVPAVPEKAVQFEASGALLIVIDKDNLARRVVVETGARTDGFVEIKNGPAVGTRVALGGGAFLLNGDAVNPISKANEPNAVSDKVAPATKVTP